MREHIPKPKPEHNHNHTKYAFRRIVELFYKKEVEQRPRVVLVNRCIVLNEENEILLLLRASNDRYSPDIWEFPGGKLDEGQDLTTALAREVWEETKLKIDPISPLVFAHSSIINKGPYQGLPYIVLVGMGKKVAGEVELSEEHSKSVWATKEKALQYNLKPELREALLALKDLK